MHYNIILGFVKESQSITSFPCIFITYVVENPIDEANVQLTTLAHKEQDEQAQAKEDRDVEEVLSSKSLISISN